MLPSFKIGKYKYDITFRYFSVIFCTTLALLNFDAVLISRSAVQGTLGKKIRNYALQYLIQALKQT